jgi:hypothetical protein
VDRDQWPGLDRANVRIERLARAARGLIKAASDRTALGAEPASPEVPEDEEDDDHHHDDREDASHEMAAFRARSRSGVARLRSTST